MNINDDKMIRISIIEDSEVHREWLKAELSDDARLALISTDHLGRKGIESVKLHKSSLVILDFQLEDMTGLEVAKRIKAYDDNIKIFVLTAHTEISIIQRIISEKTIDAVAIKGSPYLENNFISAIKHIVDGGTYLEPSLLTKLRESKDLKGLNHLTKREFEVFIQSSMGKTDAKIAEDLSVELAHIKNIKSRVVKKIKDDDIDGLLSKLIKNININDTSLCS